MAFSVISNSFKDGDYLPDRFVLGRFRLWLRRGATRRRILGGRMRRRGRKALP